MRKKATNNTTKVMLIKKTELERWDRIKTNQNEELIIIPRKEKIEAIRKERELEMDQNKSEDKKSFLDRLKSFFKF